jgi:hypothetical protein
MADDKTPPVLMPQSGVVVAGKQPDPMAGVKAIEVVAVAALKEQWKKKSTRDVLATILFAVVGAVFPGSAQAILLTQLKPIITKVLETGAE